MLLRHLLARFLGRDQRLLLGSHRLYLRKAEVVDVPAPTRCALLLPDTGETVADVHEVRATCSLTGLPQDTEDVAPGMPGPVLLRDAGMQGGSLSLGAFKGLPVRFVFHPGCLFHCRTR